MFSMRHLEEETPLSPWEEHCAYKQVNKGKQDDLQKKTVVSKTESRTPELTV